MTDVPFAPTAVTPSCSTSSLLTRADEVIE
jgi:hypothetical protein